MKEKTERSADGEAHRITARTASISDQIQQLLVARYAPVTVVVNSRGEVVYIHGHTGAYLEPAPGPPTHHLVEMARQGLQHDLALALHQAAGHEDEVVRRGLRVKTNGDIILVNLTVKRIVEPESLQGLFPVTFEQVRTEKTVGRKGVPARAMAPPKKGESGLKRELNSPSSGCSRRSKNYKLPMRSLKSTNEELQSTNEELQSTE